VKEPVLSHIKLVLYQLPCAEVVDYPMDCTNRKGTEFSKFPQDNYSNGSSNCKGIAKFNK